MELTPKQKRFIDEYLIDLNATQAAIRAGYSNKTAYSIGQENLKKPEIQKVISQKQKEHSEKTGITIERVLKERARLAFFDPRKLFNSDGSPKSIHELDDDTAAVLAGIDVVNIGNDEMGAGQVLKIKLSDKTSSLTALERHLGMYNDKMTHDITVNPAAELEALQAARRKARESRD